MRLFIHLALFFTLSRGNLDCSSNLPGEQNRLICDEIPSNGLLDSRVEVSGFRHRAGEISSPAKPLAALAEDLQYEDFLPVLHF
jgi:hypothetical protein